MAFEPNRDYDVEVTDAAMVTSNQKGTPGIEIHFANEDGDTISHTLWITPKTKDNVAKALERLGMGKATYTKPGFYAQVGTFLSGRKCSISTTEEEYQGKRRVKVQWVNAFKKPIPKDLAESIASMMGDAEGDVEDEVPF
jgi:hypothetical protein